MIQKLAFEVSNCSVVTVARTRSTTRNRALRDATHRVFLKTLAAPHDLETRAVLETGADVQIGGGVRVGDAFQALVGSQLVAIRATGELCRNFAGEVFTPRWLNQELALPRAASTKSRREKYGTGRRSEGRPRASGSMGWNKRPSG